MRHPIGLARAWWLVSILVLLLAACEITVRPVPPEEFPPTVHATVTARNTIDNTSVLSDSVAGGATRWYRVNVNTARDLLLADVEGNGLRLTVYRPSGSAMALSESPTYFAGTVSNLEASTDASAAGFIAAGRAAVEDDRAFLAALDLAEPQTISVTFNCFGPCTVTPIGSTSTYYVAVRNLTGSNRSFDLYLANYDLLDGNEPNDGQGQALPMSGVSSATGAIETLGDQDWFSYSGPDRYVTFTPYELSLGLRLRFPDGTVLDGRTGFRTTQIFDGDRFVVESNAGRAGPTATAGYAVSISNEAP